ncbi:unnamed protein product [Linum perenne]
MSAPTHNQTKLYSSHLLLALLLISPFLASARATFNIVNLGAKPDGRTDSTDAFEAAWEQACLSTRPVTLYVPKGRFLIERSMELKGPCNNNAIFIRIDGTLVAASDIWAIGNNPNWIGFQHVDGLTISGGFLDGKGAPLWSCKMSDTKHCPTGATTLGIWNSKNVIVSRVTSVNTHMYHLVINHSQNVTVKGVTLIAPGDSPNTDGIHVQQSNGVSIFNSKISTGDDCVSIGPGAVNLWIENVVCGPGHGISIGSLAKNEEEEGVQNITVKSTTFIGTTNGLRIKSWGKPSNGFVRNILFKHSNMIHVHNPIIIDQRYCPEHNCDDDTVIKKLNESGVQVKDVTYEDIQGTSATKIAVKFDCSKDYPCRGIRLENVKLTYDKEEAVALCANALGNAIGLVQPTSCLH